MKSGSHLEADNSQLRISSFSFSQGQSTTQKWGILLIRLGADDILHWKEVLSLCTHVHTSFYFNNGVVVCANAVIQFLDWRFLFNVRSYFSVSQKKAVYLKITQKGRILQHCERCTGKFNKKTWSETRVVRWRLCIISSTNYDRVLNFLKTKFFKPLICDRKI